MIAPLSASATARYNRSLHRRHPFVRVRWSPYRGRWVLEERVYRTRELDPNAYPEDRTDAYIQHRDGYVTVEYLRQLPAVSRLSDALEASRIYAFLTRSSFKSSEEWADYLDAHDQAREDRNWGNFVDGVGQIASEEYDAAQWRTGSRV